MKIINVLCLIIFVSSVLGDQEVCEKSNNEDLQICYRSKSFTRVIELNSRLGKSLELILYPGSNNTIVPYAFKSIHITALVVKKSKDDCVAPRHATSSVLILKNSFIGMRQLKSLVFSHVNATFQRPNPLARLGSLEILALRRIRLTEVPTRILASLRKLQQLDLKKNEISIIRSNSFASLKSLKTLDLSGNGIIYIKSGAFHGLSELKKLILLYNKITVSPGIFQGIPKLEGLVLDNAFGRQQFSLQAGIFDGLAELTYLSLESNNIRDIPMGVFENLKSLKELDLSDNRITRITPGAFGRLKLDYLHLSYNKIKVIETDTFNHLSVETLSLRDNKIVKLKPRAFSGAKVKLMLDLTRNHLEKIDLDDFHGFSTRLLILGENGIRTIDQGALKNAVKKGLFLEGNPIAKLTSHSELGLPESAKLHLAAKY